MEKVLKYSFAWQIDGVSLPKDCFQVISLINFGTTELKKVKLAPKSLWLPRFWYCWSSWVRISQFDRSHSILQNSFYLCEESFYTISIRYPRPSVVVFFSRMSEGLEPDVPTMTEAEAVRHCKGTYDYWMSKPRTSRRVNVLTTVFRGNTSLNASFGNFCTVKKRRIWAKHTVWC